MYTQEERTARERKRSSRTAMYLALSMCVLFALIGIAVVLYMRANRERIIDQNQQYLEDAARQKVENINDLLDTGIMSVQMVSALYELQLKSPQFDYQLLNEMSEPTPFDYMRFVSLDGVSWSGEGATIDCTDREYYLEGIQGNSGICFVGASRFTSTSILIFYTPLYYNGELIGVINGVMEAHRIADRLQATYFGQKAGCCIATMDGTIVAASWEDGTYLQGVQSGASGWSSLLSAEDMGEAMAALQAGQSLSFQYDGVTGKGNAYLAPLAGGKFMLVQTFPSGVTQAILSRVNRDSIKLEAALITIFLAYVGLIASYVVARNRRLTREKEDLSQIVDSVKRLYRRFVIFDLDEDTYEYLEAGNINALGLPARGSYSDWVRAFQQQHEATPKLWTSMERMQPEALRKTLTKEHWFAHRAYQVPGDRWERLSLIKLDMDSEETGRILGAVEDITDTKKREEENRQALETAFHAAEAASRAKSDFLSRMSHDIRTPMNAIIGLTAIMGTHLDDQERVRDCLAKITTSSKHLLGLINEVLDMSKIESGKLVLSEVEFSLPLLVDDLLSIVQPTVNAKHQELTVHIGKLRHENVIGDNLRLQQVCVNILSNAVKYTPEGGHISMTLSERPGKQPLLGEYELVFEDDGIGMTPDFLERIFTPFERAEDERVAGTQGTGLGMSITQSIVRLMGGSITVKSEEGKGSCFTVQIALKLQETNEDNVEQLLGLPVLVADDEQVACETTCIMLSELGMNGEWVLTGREAVERVTDHHDRGEDFFAVILDWKMPGMDGVETARAIRSAVGPDVPIIILSAYDWSEIENEARAAGVNAFIGKPLFKSRLRGVFVNLVSTAEPVPEDPLSSVKARDYTGCRALLVEDNDLNMEIACEILAMTGLSVEGAENGRVAVERFEAAPEGYYDIVFMDIQMPVMNGYEASRAIRALPRGDATTVPIVAMTANTFNEDVQASLEAGMVQHIGKPLDMDQLMSVLDRWLGQKQNAEAAE